MKCLTCNGWGEVLAISTPPPARKDDRNRELNEVAVTKLKRNLVRRLCTSCGGYGERPQR